MHPLRTNHLPSWHEAEVYGHTDWTSDMELWSRSAGPHTDVLDFKKYIYLFSFNQFVPVMCRGEEKMVFAYLNTVKRDQGATKCGP